MIKAMQLGAERRPGRDTASHRVAASLRAAASGPVLIQEESEGQAAEDVTRRDHNARRQGHAFQDEQHEKSPGHQGDCQHGDEDLPTKKPS
jgi:hypothetical protein